MSNAVMNKVAKSKLMKSKIAASCDAAMAGKATVACCDIRMEECSEGCMIYCTSKDDAICAMVQGLCCALECKSCNVQCLSNGEMCCQCSFAGCDCNCEMIENGVCIMCMSDDARCLQMIQQMCRCLCCCCECGCDCAVYINGTPVCCCAC